MQHALADFLRDHPEHHLELPAFYQRKRDLFCNLLNESRFSITPSAGTYFQLLDYGEITNAVDVDLAAEWTRTLKIASIPISVFYEDSQALEVPVLRFCFAKDDATLTRAAEVLCSL